MADLFALVDQFEAMLFHQFFEFYTHGFGVVVSHWDRDECSRFRVWLEVSPDSLSDKLGMFVIVERIRGYDNLRDLLATTESILESESSLQIWLICTSACHWDPSNLEHHNEACGRHHCCA
jgi:hypothetical protein